MRTHAPLVLVADKEPRIGRSGYLSLRIRQFFGNVNILTMNQLIAREGVTRSAASTALTFLGLPTHLGWTIVLGTIAWLGLKEFGGYIRMPLRFVQSFVSPTAPTATKRIQG